MNETVTNAAAPRERRFDIPFGRSDTVRKGAILAAAVLGNFAGGNILLLYTVGIFIGTLQHDFGWSRTDTALSVTWFTIVVFLGTPVVGRVADRVDPGRLAASSMLALGVALLAIPKWIHSVGSLWSVYVGLAVIGLGTSPAVVNKPVVATFSRRRGLALGAALAGAGIGTFVAPRLAAALIERGGWKLAYAGLGVVAISVAPFIWFGLGRQASSDRMRGGAQRLDSPGMSFSAAFRSKVFWVLSLMSVLAGLGMGGAVTNLVPFLRDHAMSPSEAAGLASLLGLASIAGRLVTGYTLDRVDGPLPGLPFIGIGALGLLLLVVFGIPIAAIAILFLGFVVGSEFDLLSYFTSRYFGLRAHATVFGWNYGLVAMGAAISPPVMGALRDHQGDYLMGFMLCSTALGAAALLCPVLGRYRYTV